MSENCAEVFKMFIASVQTILSLIVLIQHPGRNMSEAENSVWTLIHSNAF